MCSQCGTTVGPKAPSFNEPRFGAASTLPVGNTKGGAAGSPSPHHHHHRKKMAGGDDRETRAIDDAYCQHCQKTTPCYGYGVQSRGADEGQTMHYECSVCRHKWTLNT